MKLYSSTSARPIQRENIILLALAFILVSLTACNAQGWQPLILRTPPEPSPSAQAANTGGQTPAPTAQLPFLLEYLLTALPSATATPALPLAASPTLTPTPPAQATAALPQPTAKSPLCGGPASLLVLVLGIDENAQSDAIRLVRVDFVKPEVVILPIPRDFWVNVVDMAANGITQGRINATFGYGEYFNGPGGGIKSIITNLQSNFGVTPEHYLVLYFDEIASYIDLVGGVDLTLEQPVADGELYFAAGDHHMDGQTAVSFMRMRYYDDDFHRIRRQSQVLTAFYHKVLTSLQPAQLLSLVTRVLSDGGKALDFSLKEMYSLICLARQVKDDAVRFVEIPDSMYHHATTNLGAAVLIPHADVPAFIQDVLSGSEPR